MKALLDHDVSQWKELISLISYGKNDDAAACCDQLKKLFTAENSPTEKLIVLFTEGFEGLQALKQSLQGFFQLFYFFSLKFRCEIESRKNDFNLGPFDNDFRWSRKVPKNLC